MPEEYSKAMDLYENGKFKEAQEEFKKYKEASKSLAQFPNNFHTLSAYYEMECMRNLGDYQGLFTALQSFIKKPLVRDDHNRQLDLYVMWDAFRAEDWNRVVIIAAEMDEVELADYQRVQVAYCYGVGLHKLTRDREALIQYAIAMTVDAGGSRPLAQQSAINSLQIYYDDAEVQLAMKNWKTEDENKSSVGYLRLLAANKLAKVYVKMIRSDVTMPADYKKFLKFSAKDEEVE
jgi:hypothetical protein